jgi:hypothetical protein
MVSAPQLTNQPTNQPTNSMEQNPSREADSQLATQEIPCLLWNAKVRYRVHNSSPIRMPYVTFRNKLAFYGEELLAPRPTPKLENHPLSAVCDCLFSIFAATYLEAVSSIHTQKMRYAVTGTHKTCNLFPSLVLTLICCIPKSIQQIINRFRSVCVRKRFPGLMFDVV